MIDIKRELVELKKEYEFGVESIEIVDNVLLIKLLEDLETVTVKLTDNGFVVDNREIFESMDELLISKSLLYQNRLNNKLAGKLNALS